MCSGYPKLPTLEKKRKTHQKTCSPRQIKERHTRPYQERQFQRLGTESDYSSSYCNGSAESAGRLLVTENHSGKLSLIPRVGGIMEQRRGMSGR